MSFYRIKYYPMSSQAYQHLYFHRDRLGNRADKNTGDILETLNNKIKSDENLCRARRVIREIILSNYFELFCTFTFDEKKIDRFDYKVCLKRLTDVLKRYREYYSPSFRYLLVPEFHKNGAIHFHGMVRGIRKEDFTIPELIPKRNKKTGVLEYVPNTKKYITWKYCSDKIGWFSCSQIKMYDACAVYVSKYITKELALMPLGRKLYTCSHDLDRAEVVFDEDHILPTYGRPDFSNEFVEMKYSDSPLGFLPDYWQESCSDVRNPEQDEFSEKDIFVPMTTKELLRWTNDGFSYKIAVGQDF